MQPSRRRSGGHSQTSGRESAHERQHAQEAEEKQRAKAKADRRAENCQRARERLFLLQQNIPLMRMHGQGQRQTVSPAERAAAM